MKLDALREKLLAAARGNPPSDRVPYAFEQRILARVSDPSAPGRALSFASSLDSLRGLWLGAAACVGVAIVTSVWTYAPLGSKPSADASDPLEQTVLAAADDVDSID